jgi:hypothetical protein
MFSMVITLSNLPPSIELALVARATAEQRPVESVVLDVVARELGVTLPRAADTAAQAGSPDNSSTSDRSECKQLDTSKTTYTTNEFGAILVRSATTDADGKPLPKRRDLSDLAGTWVEDPEFDAALEDQRRIDWELWR